MRELPNELCSSAKAVKLVYWRRLETALFIKASIGGHGLSRPPTTEAANMPSVRRTRKLAGAAEIPQPAVVAHSAIIHLSVKRQPLPCQ